MRVTWFRKQDNRRTVALGHTTLERFVFDFSEFSFVSTRKTLLYVENAVTERCVRGYASVCPYVTYVLVMHMLVKQEILEFIITGGTKMCILLREFRQDFLEFFRMYETEFPSVNVVKDFRREGIKMC